MITKNTYHFPPEKYALIKKIVVVLPLENEQEYEENPSLRCRFRGNT